jgi:hypothetical protein
MMDKRQQIIQEIQRVARELGMEGVPQREFLARTQITEKQIRYHCGTWNEAVVAAGLTPRPNTTPPRPLSIPDEELFAEIRRLWLELGRRPKASSMNSKGKYSEAPYRNRWKTFDGAVDEYVHRHGEPMGAQSATESLPRERHDNRPLLIPKTKKPSAALSRKRDIYGEPIEFRGLRYSPINEQGVVYLFGMVSRELGFLIESIRTDFPDCEGKRALDKGAKKWQHVRIEFEYESKNFLVHHHDPDGCDLIICWLHDWPECPLEVLELKSTLELLPKR